MKLQNTGFICSLGGGNPPPRAEKLCDVLFEEWGVTITPRHRGTVNVPDQFHGDFDRFVAGSQSIPSTQQPLWIHATFHGII